MAKKNKDAKVDPPPVNTVVEKKSSKLLPALLCAVVIAVVTWFVFSPSLQNGFTNIDDDAYVLYNPLVVNNTVQVKEVFKTPVALNYHPLTVLSLAWNYQAGGLNPYGYHLVNIIFHVLNTVLVFFFIFLLTRKKLLMTVIVALFFGIHPMHVESVSWVSERKDVLYVFFFLTGLITYLYYRETKKTGWYLFTILLFILSCLSKGMAVIFPLILLLVDYLLSIKWDKKLVTEKIPFFIISIAFGIAAFAIQKSGGSMTDEAGTSFTHRIMIASYGLVMYVYKLFIPSPLAVMYLHIVNGKGNLPLIFYLSPFIVLVGLLLVYFLFRKNKNIVFGLLFYLCSVILVLQFFSVGSTVMADRYSYLSYIGLLYVVAYGVNEVWRTTHRSFSFIKYPLGVILVIVAVLFSYQTYVRTQVWKNSQTLWTDEVSKYSQVPFNHLEQLMVKSGLLYQQVKKYDLAMDNFNCALILVPNDTNALYYRANLQYQRASYDSALADYSHTIEFGTHKASAYVNRALVFIQKKDFPFADKDFAMAIRLDSNSESNYFNRGLYYNQTNQDEKALADFSKCLQFKANNDSIYNWLGVSNHKLKRYQDAIINFSRAIELNPKSGQYWLNRSFSENALNKRDEAGKDAIKAQQLGLQVDPNYLKFLGLK